MVQFQLVGLGPVDAMQRLPDEAALGAEVGEAVMHLGEDGLVIMNEAGPVSQVRGLR